MPARLAAELLVRLVARVAWKSRSAISAETTPASTIPSRNSAGRRKRSEPGIRAKRTPWLGARNRSGGATTALYAAGAVVRSDATL